MFDMALFLLSLAFPGVCQNMKLLYILPSNIPWLSTQFTPDIIHPGQLDHKWTTLNTTVNDHNDRLWLDNSNYLPKWSDTFDLTVKFFFNVECCGCFDEHVAVLITKKKEGSMVINTDVRGWSVVKQDT